MRTRAPAILTGCLLSWGTSARVLADGVVRDSIGAISSGRGGTNIAHWDNAAIIHDNPAGLANIEDDGFFEFGLDLLFTDLDYTDPQNNADAEVLPFGLPEFAYARKSQDGRFGYGIGVFIPAGFGSQWRLKHRLYGSREYRSLGTLVKVLPAAAYQITDRLSVGGAFGLAISHIQLEMPDNFQTGLARGLPALIDLEATGFAPAWSLGLQYKLSDRTTLGLVYTGETRFRLQGNIDVDVSGFGFPLLRSRHDAQVDLVWPRSVGAGLTHRFNAKHRSSIDVVWFDWSHAFDKLDLELSNGSNPLFNLMLLPSRRDRLPMRWHDSVSVRLGHEYFINADDVLRIGYTYHPNPVPDDTMLPVLPGILDRLRTQMKRWRFDVAYQYSLGRTREIGRSRFIGGDFDSSTNKAQAHWLSLGFTYSF